MSKLNVELVTPEALVFSSGVEMVVVPGEQGDFGVLANHAPMISSLRPGVIDIYEKRIEALESEVKELHQKHEELILRFQTKAIKSRGRKNEIIS